jgi:hypothetical protein
MNLDRRQFLRNLGLVVPAVVVVPSFTSYFFAPKNGWHIGKWESDIISHPEILREYQVRKSFGMLDVPRTFTLKMLVKSENPAIDNNCGEWTFDRREVDYLTYKDLFNNCARLEENRTRKVRGMVQHAKIELVQV